IVKWLKKVGETVARDEPLFEISTDKVDAEIPSPAAGVLSAIKVKEGETVVIKTVVGILETDAAKGASAQAASSAPAPWPAATEAPRAGPAPPSAQRSPSPSRAPGGAGGGAGARPAVGGSGGAPARPAPVSQPAAATSGGGVALLEERLRTKSSPVVRKIA